MDRNTTNDPGLSDSAPPQVGIAAPNGGEIIDTGSTFTICWNATDNVGVASQDLLLSTDAGNTWATITTGLATGVNQYVWTAPLIANNQSARIRVVVRDAACNVSRDDSDANFTIWNPPASFTHQSEAPLFFAGQGFTSTVYMSNTSSNPVVVELDPHKPNGNGTQNLPYQIALSPGRSATLDAATLFSIGASAENPAVPDIINGGIRLRHNGSQDNDVRAVVVAQRGCSEEFTTPFTYAASSQSATGTMQCGPMYYVDNQTNAFVALQNITNAPQTVQLTCNYGTGAPGTPNGQVRNQPITLGPQQTFVVNLASIWGAFGGAEWGSMEVFTTEPKSVVCHSVMMSAQNGIAWDCPFVDPAVSVSTTKVAEAVNLDYNTGENAYIMVCNASSTDTRTVTASFNTNNGVTIPPVQVTIAPGAQQMITLNAQQLLSPGASTTADARLTYTGNSSDIVAAGCSTSPSAGRAVPVKFKEASASDGRRLTSPFFRFDEKVSGKLQVSNFGSSSVKVGARMVFANSSAKPLKTGIITIPAGGVGTIDLSSANDGVPDFVDSAGRVDLVHSGPAGTVAAAVTAMGCHNNGQVVPLDGGPPIDPVTLFPAGVVVIPGGCTVMDAITDGTVTDPVLTSSNPCFGTAIQTFGTGPNTYQTTICVPIACSSDVPIDWTPGGGGAGDESDLVVIQKNFADFTTSVGNGRLNPNGTTQFTLTAQSALPNALLQVDFNGKGGSVFTQIQGNGVSASITGTGPLNHAFLGRVKKIVVTQLNPDGTPNTSVPTVLKAKSTGAYFALDKPISITSITPNAVPVTGGTVTIKGTGILTWELGSGFNTVTINPTVLIGKTNGHDQIPFTVITVPDTSTILGNVGPTPNEIGTCADVGETPCKTITVINPGGSDGVDDLTSQKLLTINAPPPPVITGTASLIVGGSSGPATSNSIGASGFKIVNGFSAPVPVTAQIFGRNLTRVRSVTFVGAGPVTIGPSNIKSNGTRIEVGVPAICLAGGSASVAMTLDDGVNAPASFANGWIFTTTGPVQVALPGLPLNIVAAYLVGSCETVGVTITTFPDGSLQVFDCRSGIAACVNVPRFNVAQHGFLSALFPNSNIALFSVTTDCSGCSVFQPGTYTGFFQAEAQNNNAPSNSVTACFSRSCTVH